MVDLFMHKNQPSPKKKLEAFVLDLDLYHEYYPVWVPNSFTKIAEPFEVVTTVLKYMGNGPISTRKVIYDPKSKSEKLIYEVNWRCWGTFASGLVGLAAITVWVLFLINIGLETPFLITWIITYKDIDNLLREESADTSMRGMIKKSYVITSVVVITEIISRWCHAGRFAAFLNGWHDFEKKLEQNFPHYEYEYNFRSISKLRDSLLLFYVTYPSMILLPAYLCVYCSKLHIFAQILATIICFQFITVSLLEDVKMFLSYKAISQAFQQVRKCMQAHDEAKKVLPQERAQSWRLLVLYIRNQGHRCSECNKVEELSRLIGNMALLTLGLYIILNGWEYAQKRNDILFLSSMMGLCCMIVGRTYCKAAMAEQITQEELLLARTIAGMSTSGQDATTVLELKCLADTVAMKPVQISFGNYVVMNKRLLLGMFSQVVTYLIVLMQFSQPNKSTF